MTAPRGRFILVFFCVYLAVYLFFAIIYVMWPPYCMMESERNFGHSFWFSFWTASTIGYSGATLYPNPDCDVFNLIVMVNIIFANLLDYCLMGVVFARFAAPMPKAKAIRFSSKAVLYQTDPSSYWRLSFRVANIRKHSILQPEISVFLAVPEHPSDPTNSDLGFEQLTLHNSQCQAVNLKLGLLATVVHIVDPSSPLFDLSMEDMESRGMEILCFLDGMDPMTSNSMQARHSYRPSEIKMNERLNAIEIQSRRGKFGLDFTQFDLTTGTSDLRSHVVNVTRLRGQKMSSLSPLAPPPIIRMQGAGEEVKGTDRTGLSRNVNSLALIEQILSDPNSSSLNRSLANLAKTEILSSGLPLSSGINTNFSLASDDGGNNSPNPGPSNDVARLVRHHHEIELLTSTPQSNI